MWHAIAILAFALPAARADALTNGDFSSGLDGWQTAGPVAVEAAELVLRDEGPASSGAWQVVEATGPQARLDFEMLASLSAFTPSEPFGFPDVFAVSVYLLDDPTDFDPGDGLAAGAHSVLSVDAGGPYDVFAMVTPSARGGDWLHVQMQFATPNGWFAPSFELFELAFAPGDSVVRIDDVGVFAVPEPGTGLLLAVGLAATLRRRFRARAGRGAA